MRAKPKYQDSPLQTHWGSYPWVPGVDQESPPSASSRRIHGDCICLICFFSPKECFIDHWWHLVVERNLCISGHLVLQTGKATWRGMSLCHWFCWRGKSAAGGREATALMSQVCVSGSGGCPALTQTQESPLHIWATLSWLLWEGWGGTEFQSLQLPASKSQPSRREPGITLITSWGSPGETLMIHVL